MILYLKLHLEVNYQEYYCQAYATVKEKTAQPEIQFKPQKIEVRVQVRFKLNKSP